MAEKEKVEKLMARYHELVNGGNDKLAVLVIFCAFLNLPKPSLLEDGEIYIQVDGEADYRAKLENELLNMLQEHLQDPLFGEGL